MSLHCLKPVMVNIAKSDGGFCLVPVRCMKCANCRAYRSREWTIRLVHESQYHRYISFVTLTYSDEFVPSSGSLVKKDFQDFMKRLRYFHESKFKFYACGEYGGITMRPHYHAIIFDKIPLEELEKAWSLGFVQSKSVSSDSALAYVAGYVDKKIYDNISEYTNKGLLPPFVLCSQGIGKQFALDNQEMILNRGFITYNGSKIGIPRYYRKVLGLECDSDVILRMKIEDLIEANEYYNDDFYMNDDRFYQYRTRKYQGFQQTAITRTRKHLENIKNKGI